MLDLRRMMLLCDLADLGSVTAVAERRGITGSAVSQQLRVLEKEAGAILFRRDGRTLSLTRSGHVLVEHLRRVIGAVDEAISAVAATTGAVSGHLAVTAFNLAVPTLAAPMLRYLSAEQPGLQVHLQQDSTPEALRLLRQGEIDVAITCRYEFEEDVWPGGLTGERLLLEPMVLIVPKQLHLKVRSRGLAALADLPWITGPRDTGLDLALTRATEAAGFTPHVVHRLVGARNVSDLAATGVAVAMVPRLAVAPQDEALIVDSLDLGARSVGAVVREGRQRDPNIALILRTLRRVAAELDVVPQRSHLGIAS